MAEQWLSYQQIGEALGISSAAARHKVSRNRFARRLRNDGRSEVLVDLDELRARMPVRRPKRARSEAAEHPAETPPSALIIASLQARLVELEARLLDARSEAAQARSDADQARADAQCERGERLEERARAERLAGEVAEIAKKLAELTAAAQARRPVSLPPSDPVRRTWWPWRRAG